MMSATVGAASVDDIHDNFTPGPVEDPHAQAWERTYATFVHLTLVALHVVPLPGVGALIMWSIKRRESPFIDDHGKEAINFQLSLLLYFLLSLALVPACGIGGFMIAGVYVLGIVGVIMAAIAANNGRFFRYPMCIRFVR